MNGQTKHAIYRAYDFLRDLLITNYNRFIALFVITAFINTFAFAYTNANPLIRSDGWRFISRYLVPWHEGSLNWQDLWLDHHPQPITASLFIINAITLDLRMDIDSMIAACFALASCFVLWSAFDRHMRRNPSRDYSHLTSGAFITITCLYIFSLNSTVVYSWPLVALGHISLLFMFLTLRHIDDNLNDTSGWTHLVTIALATALLVIFFSEGAKIFIYSIIMSSLLTAIICRERTYILISIAALTGLIIQWIFYRQIGVESKYVAGGLLNTIDEKVPHLTDYLLYIGTGQMSAWINIKSVASSLGEHSHLLLIGSVLTLALYAASIIVYYSKKLYKRTLTPITLIFTSLLAGLGAATFRFDPTTQQSLSYIPRYYLLYMLGVVGVIWIWAALFPRLSSKPSKVISQCILALLLLSQILMTFGAWNSTIYRHRSYVKGYEAMLNNSEGNYETKPPRWITGSNYPEPYKSNLLFLKKEKLNVFSNTINMDRYKR